MLIINYFIYNSLNKYAQILINLKMTRCKIKVKKILIILLGLLFLKNLIIIGNISSLFPNIYSKSNSSKIFNNIKSALKDKIYIMMKKNITNINSLYIKGALRFGNYLISLNNAIIFCEVLGCKKIILEYNRNGFINNKIFYEKYNIIIDSNCSFNFIDNNSIIVDVRFFFYRLNFTDFGKVNRFYVLRKEIINNLPKVKLNFDDLFIYIRGGDIFRILNKSVQHYTQPPLCFYKRILNEFNFRKVTIISEDKFNPVISVLLEEYSYIKYNKNNIKLDISYLVNSYNIVSATSSFILSIFKLNQNLKFVWEYDFYKFIERYLLLHYSVYTFSLNYIIYKMNIHDHYKKLMYPFQNSQEQRNVMIKEKCENNFYIILPRI